MLPTFKWLNHVDQSLFVPCWLIWHKCHKAYTVMNCPSCVVVPGHYDPYSQNNGHFFDFSLELLNSYLSFKSVIWIYEIHVTLTFYVISTLMLYLFVKMPNERRSMRTYVINKQNYFCQPNEQIVDCILCVLNKIIE